MSRGHQSTTGQVDGGDCGEGGGAGGGDVEADVAAATRLGDNGGRVGVGGGRAGVWRRRKSRAGRYVGIAVRRAKSPGGGLEVDWGLGSLGGLVADRWRHSDNGALETEFHSVTEIARWRQVGVPEAVRVAGITGRDGFKRRGGTGRDGARRGGSG